MSKQCKHGVNKDSGTKCFQCASFDKAKGRLLRQAEKLDAGEEAIRRSIERANKRDWSVAITQS